MATDYAAKAAKATAQIRKAGQAVVITGPGVQAYDPDTDTVTAAAPVSMSGVGALFDYNLRDAGVRHQGEAVIQVGDKRLLLAVEGITAEPQPGFKATVAGTVYNVMQVKATAPAGVPVLYELHLRR